MKALSKAAFGAAILTLTAGSASAAVVCNEEGDCWRVTGEPRYEPSLKLRIQKDDWKWKEGEKYRWREPGRGNGYWREGVWIEILVVSNKRAALVEGGFSYADHFGFRRA